MRNEERILMLGTGHATVTRCYNACFLLSMPGFNLLVDAGGGNGILRQLEKSGTPISDINAIFVTHVHTDHVLGVVWVLRMIGEHIESGTYNRHCTVYGNINVIDLLYSIITKSFSPKFNRQLFDYVDLKVIEDGDTIEHNEELTLSVFDVHTNTPQLGFKATLPSGTCVACCGDAPLSRVAPSSVEGSDWLIAEAFCLESDRNKFHPERICHGTVKDTASMAQELGVENLVIYHTEDSEVANRKKRYGAEATLYFKGTVYVPDDLEIIHIGLEGV
ncbi:MAG: MBL fold metallo-hydrolase [Muribaculaceae bacterium]|nr:MBL fold metallo-hydrolase [Muribaculaceae bacterium]